jgi:hypothetical protein
MPAELRGILILLLLIGGGMTPALLFRWYLRRYGGMANPDETARSVSAGLRRYTDE